MLRPTSCGIRTLLAVIMLFFVSRPVFAETIRASNSLEGTAVDIMVPLNDRSIVVITSDLIAKRRVVYVCSIADNTVTNIGTLKSRENFEPYGVSEHGIIVSTLHGSLLRPSYKLERLILSDSSFKLKEVCNIEGVTNRYLVYVLPQSKEVVCVLTETDRRELLVELLLEGRRKGALENVPGNLLCNIVNVSHDGNLLIVGADEQTKSDTVTTLYSTETAKPLWTRRTVAGGQVSSLCFCDGDNIVVGTRSGSIEVRKRNDGQLVRRSSLDARNADKDSIVNNIAGNASTFHAAIHSGNHGVTLLDLKTLRLDQLTIPERIEQIAMMPDGLTVVVAHRNGSDGIMLSYLEWKK